jgi:hypothetical protein
MFANGGQYAKSSLRADVFALLPTSDVIRQRSSWATSITARVVGHCACGTAAATFDEARADFEAAWRVFLSKWTEVDFQEWRDQRLRKSRVFLRDFPSDNCPFPRASYVRLNNARRMS